MWYEFYFSLTNVNGKWTTRVAVLYDLTQNLQGTSEKECRSFTGKKTTLQAMTMILFNLPGRITIQDLKDHPPTQSILMTLSPPYPVVM